MTAMKMRQSLAQIEQAFEYETQLEEKQSEQLLRHVHVRSRKRTVQREKKRSSFRFYMLALSLVLVALGVTAAMFETLYLLLA
ncbi:MAG TPA: hypothetical protein VG405_12315 [Solirubrobacteraceae bacterium]|nr:hypothetical protein [Solirubrobacteraceae bacterium]